jgi:hypothetical protein
MPDIPPGTSYVVSATNAQCYALGHTMQMLLPLSKILGNFFSALVVRSLEMVSFQQDWKRESLATVTHYSVTSSSTMSASHVSMEWLDSIVNLYTY